MATYLKPDSTKILNGVTVHEYLLTKHNPNKIAMPTGSMDGIVVGITVHNTERIKVASATTPAEQYTRATYNGNMNDVRVHLYTDDICAWQNLPFTLPGWHAADGSGNGNRKTIAIECIMSSRYDDKDKKSEDNCARLAAYLLHQYGLGVENLYTHTHWLNVRDGKAGTTDELNVMHHSKKMCPAYILPHWNEFKAKVATYLNGIAATEKKETTQNLYRIRKAWDDADSQTGAYAGLQGAIEKCKESGNEYKVFDSEGKIVYSAENEESAEDSTFSLDINIAGEKYVVEGELKKA